MPDTRLLLCTDMDRTIIPNGRHPEHPGARERFYKLCRLPEVHLAYVTGRSLGLVLPAIKQYNLPEPDYIISDVGTKIYQKKGKSWGALLSWQKQIAKGWQGKSHGQLQHILSDLPELELQEASKQSEYKLSYYVSLAAEHKKIVQQVANRSQRLGVEASLITSIDEEKQVVLLDILPKNATKLHAIEFLRQRLGFELTETLFAGDSGNDLPVLASYVPSVLVANASQDIKRQARELAGENGCREALHVAEHLSSTFGGNYSAGVLQGVAFYAPEIMKKMSC